MPALPPQLVAGQNSLVFGFRGGQESAYECETRSGEIQNSPSCLDLYLAGQLAYEAELEASNLRYDSAVTLAVMGITVEGYGIGMKLATCFWNGA